MANYLIDFINSATAENIEAYFLENGCTILTRYASLDKVYHISAAACPPKTDIIDMIVADDTDACKLLAVVPVPQLQVTEQVGIDVHAEKDWWKAYSTMDVDFNSATVEIPRCGTNVNVYLVDSGIDSSHPEFVGRDITLLHSVTGEFTDTNGHGTALASLIVGNTCGMTNASLKVVKLFDSSRQTLQSDILKAIDVIIQDSLASPNAVAVVNLSWAIPKNEYIEQKLRVLIGTGAGVVVAAGNSGIPIENVTPASMPEVMTIGSYGINFVPSNFSDYSNQTIVSSTYDQVNTGALDSWAPGEKIWCAQVGGGYGFAVGTSISAAIYSGAIAFNLSKSLTSSNDILSVHRTSDGLIKWSSFDRMDRTGLLDLSDPKYSTSQNKICTYVNRFNPATSNIVNPMKVVAKVGSSESMHLFIYELTETYELLSPLPPGARMERNILTYSPTIEPIEDSGVNIQTVNYTVTNRTGEVINNYITIVTLSTTFNQAALPPDDPLINITLMGTVCTNTLTGQNCWSHYTCGSFYCLDNTGGKYCTCG